MTGVQTCALPISNSTISGLSVEINAYDDDSHTVPVLSDTLDPTNPLGAVQVSTFDLVSEAKVKIGTGASVTSDRSIEVSARTIQTQPLLPTFESLISATLGDDKFGNLANFNFLAIKTGKATIEINGLLQAAAAIRATAQALIHISAASDNISFVMPLSIGVASALAQILTGDGADRKSVV